MAPVSIAVVRVRWESVKPGPQHCAITYPQCCGGRRDRSRTAGGPTTTRPGPPAPSDMLPVGCPRAAQVGACFKGATAWGNAYPCPERQHHVCCPPGMATLARATGSARGLCNMEGKRLSMPGTAASRMLPSEHGDIGTSDWIRPRAERIYLTEAPRACFSCGARKGVGVRGNLTVMGPRVTGAQSAPCPALNGPSGASRGSSAAGLTQGLHLPRSRGERRPTGPALSLATTTLWWRSGLGQHSPQDATRPIQDRGTMCFFFFFLGPRAPCTRSLVRR